MASAAATCSPSSLQLRLAFNGRTCRNPSLLLARMQVRKLDHGGRLFSAVRNGPLRSSRVRSSDAAAQDFSGWSDSGNSEDKSPEEYDRKKWFEGILGKGIAGILLLGGLTFAAFSLSKQSNSRPNPHKEPLKVEQFVTSAAEEQGDIGKDGNEDTNIEQNDSSPRSETGIDENSPSPEFVEASTENKLGDETDIRNPLVHDVGNTSNGTDAIKSPSFQENLQYESAFDDNSIAPDTDTGSLKLNEPETIDKSFIAHEYNDSVTSLTMVSLELSSEENLAKVELTNFSVSDPTSTDLYTNEEGIPGSSEDENSNLSFDSSSSFIIHTPSELVADILAKDDLETIAPPSTTDNLDLSETPQVSIEHNSSFININETESSGIPSVSSVSPFANEQDTNDHNEMNRNTSFYVSPNPGVSFSSAGIPAPSVVSAALQVLPGKVLVPSIVDQVQGQALAALQVLKVIEADVQPTELCTRREYARWLVIASNALSRNSISKVYPAMYIENVSELAFDDVTPEDPDFASIQGLAEAGLISSKLSRRDMLSSLDEKESPFYFYPESPLSRQDLVSWKMALEKRQLPEADRKILQQLSGFIDTDKIDLDACPALVADLSAGEQGIIALAFGYTRLFQPDKPVTNAQAAIALAVGEASDLVSEELARIEAESMAENAVLAHNELVAQVEKDINASFEKELIVEKERIDVVGKMAEEARRELEKLKAEREEDNVALLKERAAVEAEMEVLSKLRREVEDQLQSLMSNKVEIAFEKERISQLRSEAESESQEITRLQYELEIERKALSMARSWAEDEAKRAKEQAKALEVARDRWERHGIKVVIDNDLREEMSSATTWVNAGEKFSIGGTVQRAENLVTKLKALAAQVKGKSKDIINKIVQNIMLLISKLKEWVSNAGTRAIELKGAAISKASRSAQELQHNAAEFRVTVKEGAKRVAGDCRERVEKLTEKFKT